MAYRLSPTAKPDLFIQIDARHADAILSATTISQRVMEITHGGRSMLGVLCRGRERYFGKIAVPGPLSGPVVEAPTVLESYGGSMNLAEQKAIFTAFRRVLAGTIRNAMSSVSTAFDEAVIYFAFQQLGAITIVPAGEGDWSLAALRLEGAKTMEVERACAEVNRASLNTYAVIWRTLSEMQERAQTEEAQRQAERREEDDRRVSDLLDSSDDDGSPFGPSALELEEDEIDDDSGMMDDRMRDVPDPTYEGESPAGPYDDEETEGPFSPRFQDDLDDVKF